MTRERFVVGRAVERTLLACALALMPAWVAAFGLKTHIWMGQQLLGELQDSCRVQIESVPISINKQVCESVRAHPKAFLSGVLGPDGYPDLITGQVTTHPGVKGDWQTADWLIHMYATTPPGPALAFAAGYLVHAAGDVFAHTYVNAYSGDIFALGDERAVERRHFVLEKYIDAKLPGFRYDPGMLAPPSGWLRDKLIHNSDAARNSMKSGLALHVSSMYGVYRSVTDLAKDLDGIERDAGRLLAEIIVTIGESEIKVANGEVQLKAARELLSANEAKLRAEQALFDDANVALQKAAKALQDNMDLINLRGLEARAAREAADAARRAGTDAIAAVNSLQNEVSNLQNRIANTPATVAREVCENRTIVNGACTWTCPGGPLNPLCRNVCRDVTERVCRVVQAVNEVYTGLTNQLNNAQQALNNAQARAQQASLDATTQAAIEASKLQEKASAEALTASLEAAKTAAQATHDLHQVRLKVELEATRETRKKADELEAQLAKLREQLFNARSIKAAITDLIASSNILSGLARNWLHGMNIAGNEFIIASHRVIEGMLVGKSHFVSSYLEWWKCFGNAYVAIPVQFGQATCAYEDFIAKMENEANKIIERTLPPPFNDVYRRALQIKVDITTTVKQKVSDAGLQLAKLVAPDATTADFIELLVRPENATQDKLNAVFSETGNAAGKPLLLFGRISAMIDADLAISNDRLDPQKFYALKNALVLSKLALMDASAVKGLVWVLGGDPALVFTPPSPGRSSLLFDMVRSIDGNHQWQPFGLPYPSSAGSKPRPENAMERRFGYGPGQERPGFQLFVNPSLRKTVFLRIFEGPVSGSLASHLSGYPFPECVGNPFPLAFKPDGTARDSDHSCTSKTIEHEAESRLSFWRRIVNRVRLNPYDPF